MSDVNQPVVLIPADLAENYLADRNYEAGQVLQFGGTKEVTLAEPGSNAVAGVVSTNPATVMNGNLKGSTVVAIALVGRVPVNAIGPIKKGDLLISAGYGYAKAWENPAPGQSIGKALGELPIGIKGIVEVAVSRF